MPKKINLNNGIECPILGFGNNEDNLQLAKRMTKDAIEAGYRHIDTAAYYENEEAVGEALNELIKQRRIKRDEVFVTSKLFFQNYPQTNRRQKTVENVLLALQKLKLDYVDLMLLHWPSNDPQVNSEIWSGLEDAMDSRYVRSIGVSNFNVDQIQKLLENNENNTTNESNQK